MKIRYCFFGVVFLLLISCGGGGGGGGGVSSPTPTPTPTPTPIATTAPNLVMSALNDTGVMSFGYGGEGVSCISALAGNDCNAGRDYHQNDDSDGRGGFSFTKLNELGGELSGDAEHWSCIKDNVTGLIWENKAKDNSATIYSLLYGGDSAAERYVSAINAAGLCGARDWRLPTRNELLSIVDFGVEGDGVAVDDRWFSYSQSGAYWTSEWQTNEFAYKVIFSGGASTIAHEGESGYVRLVRGVVEKNLNRFVLTGDGAEVIDVNTGLVWKRCVEGMVVVDGACDGVANMYTHSDALGRAAVERNITGENWRVPNIKELSSILNDSSIKEPLDAVAFPVVFNNSVWSSTPYSRDLSMAWYSRTYSRNTIPMSRSSVLGVRLVRDLP